MLKYLVVLLGDAAVPYCHYEGRGASERLISPDALRRGLVFAMKENLTVQFVYPPHGVPDEIVDLTGMVDHADIKPVEEAQAGDVGVAADWDALAAPAQCEAVVVRTSLAELMRRKDELVAAMQRFARVNVVIADIASLTEDDMKLYGEWLDGMARATRALLEAGTAVQLNLLTDRVALGKMNNCNAGHESITLAPDGNFYQCPGFYYDGSEPCGNPVDGYRVSNPELYRLDHAPICRRCDAWHCRRCVWLNRRKTLEVNTPGHIQCVVSHMERNAARMIRPDIPQIDYLDPFYTIK